MPHLSFQRFKKVHRGKASGFTQFSYQKQIPWRVICFLLALNNHSLPTLCSSKFKSFSYLYNEDQFIAGLINDVTIVKSLPPKLNELRKLRQFPIFKPKTSANPTFYIKEVLPKLKEAKVVGLVLHDGGCLQVPCPFPLKSISKEIILLYSGPCRGLQHLSLSLANTQKHHLLHLPTGWN